MTLITKHKNRQTKTMIAIHFTDWINPLTRTPEQYYSTECRGHGDIAEWDNITEARRMASRPLEWCIGCIEGDEAVENHNGQTG